MRESQISEQCCYLGIHVSHPPTRSSEWVMSPKPNPSSRLVADTAGAMVTGEVTHSPAGQGAQGQGFFSGANSP